MFNAGCTLLSRRPCCDYVDLCRAFEIFVKGMHLTGRQWHTPPASWSRPAPSRSPPCPPGLTGLPRAALPHCRQQCQSASAAAGLPPAQLPCKHRRVTRALRVCCNSREMHNRLQIYIGSGNPCLERTSCFSVSAFLAGLPTQEALHACGLALLFMFTLRHLDSRTCDTVPWGATLR